MIREVFQLRLYILMLCLCSVLFLNAQSEHSYKNRFDPYLNKDSIFVSLEMLQIDSLKNKNQYNETIDRLDTLINILDNNNLLYGRAHLMALQKKAHSYHKIRKYEEAVKIFDKSLKVLNSVKTEDNILIGSMSHLMGNALKGKGDFAQAKAKMKVAELCFSKNTDTRSKKKLASVYNDFGIVYRLQGLYRKAISYYNNSLEIKRELYGEESIKLASGYNNLGTAYSQLGDFSKARLYYKKAIELRTQKHGKLHTSLIGTYLNMGSLSYELKDYQLGVLYSQLALDCIDKFFPENNYEKVNIYGNLSKLHLEIGDTISAKKYLQKIRSTEGLNEDYKLKSIINSEITKCNINFNNGKSIQHKAIIQKIDFFDKNYTNNIQDSLWVGAQYLNLAPSTSDRNVRLSYYNMAQNYINHSDVYEAKYFTAKVNWGKALAYKDLGLYEEAILYIKKSKKFFSSKINDDLFKYPDEYIRILRLSGDIFFSLYDLNKRTEDLYNSFKYYKEAQLESQIYQNILQNDDSRINLIDDHFYAYEAGIEAGSLLFTEMPEIFNDLFESIEQSKNILFREKNKLNHILSNSANSDGRIESIRNLQLDISYLSRRLLEIDSSKLESSIYYQELLESKRKYQAELSVLQEEEPYYYSNYLENKIPELNSIQKKLFDKNKVIMEYFVTNKLITSISITKDTYSLQTTYINFDLNKLVDSLLTSITAPFNSNLNHQEAKNNFINHSHKLYKLLIKPHEEIIGKTEEISIIPDGVLGYIPFEILLEAKHPKSNRYPDFNYLINNFQINYGHSVNSILFNDEILDKERASNNILAFAPIFNENLNYKEYKNSDSQRSINKTSWLTPLKYNLEEAQIILENIKGDLYSKEKATKQQFLSIAPKYQIIHLATHAKTNNQTSDLSYLAFAESGDSSSNLLYNNELYNLNLNANMVVLSACETGSGKIQKGEGVISLARGFSIAGAKSIVTSLWNVNDKSTKEIMSSFYKHLANGLNKDEALRNAKLEYLALSPNNEPFYWAPFIAIGDMSKIEKNNANWSYMFFGLLILLLLFILVKNKSIN